MIKHVVYCLGAAFVCCHVPNGGADDLIRSDLSHLQGEWSLLYTFDDEGLFFQKDRKMKWRIRGGDLIGFYNVGDSFKSSISITPHKQPKKMMITTTGASNGPSVVIFNYEVTKTHLTLTFGSKRPDLDPCNLKPTELRVWKFSRDKK